MEAWGRNRGVTTGSTFQAAIRMGWGYFKKTPPSKHRRPHPGRTTTDRKQEEGPPAEKTGNN